MSAHTHARLTELFGEAIELPTTERDALLARVRATDPALARELAALLDADRRAVTALATGALADHDSGTDTTVQAAGDDLATSRERPRAAAALPTIAGYRLLGVLGEGGMGTVYAAEQDAPRRAVAIKVLHARSHAALARFWQETEIMARLDHPGIAKIFEAGDANGHPFFAMERVDGVTLDVAVATRGRRERLALFVAICDAVHHAHVKGIFHRDLKPSNVMVRADGRVAVLDFGIARVAAGDGETRAGELVGTPVYMSPEQARLRPDEVDARSDVYTLGVILYELLADALPYEVRGKPLTEIARLICEAPPLAPRDRALRGDLQAICDHALAKAPAERYPSAAALADDVRRYLAGARVSVRVPGALEQLRRFVRRRPGLAAAIVAGLVAAAAVTGLWLDARAGWRRADAERVRVARAHAALEERTNQLVLDQARQALAHDPTRALALLATLTPRGTDPEVAWQIANEARGRGVAAAVHRGHTDEVRWVEATADAIVSAGYDGRVLRWAADGSRELARGPGRAHVVRASPDGTRFAIGFDGGAARVVDAAGAVVADVGPLAGDVEAIAWAADGTHLALADDRGSVVAWSPARRWQLGAADGGIEAVAWAADRATLVAGGDDGQVRWWDVASGAAAVARTGREVLAVWTDGARMAAVTEDGRVWRWRLAGAEAVLEDERATGVTGKTAAFAPDGASVVIGGIDGRVVHVGTAAITALTPHPRQVRAVAASADGRWFATASDDGLIQAWELGAGRHLTLRGHAQRVRQLAFAPGDELVSGDSEGVVRRWRLAAIPATVLQPPAAIARVAVATDRASIVVADVEGALRRWDLATGATQPLGTHARITAVAAHATFAVTADADGTVAWWGTTAARRTAPAPVRAVAISADGRWVAAATAAGPIALYRGDGSVVATLAGHAGGTDAIAFTPDGALLISGGQDRVVRVWNPAQPAGASQELGAIDGDTRHVVIAGGGTRVVTAGDDGRVRAWEVRAGVVDPASVRVLAAHPGAVIALATDGADRIVSVGRDRSRTELELATDARRTAVVGGASQPADVGASTLRAVALPLSATRDLTVAHDGSALVVGDATPHDFAALQQLLAR